MFTANINKSEHYSELLSKKNIKHTVLNAKNHEGEAEIIANAGKKNSVIITTSISGRGVDIKLGGKKLTQINEKDEIKSFKPFPKQKEVSMRVPQNNFFVGGRVPPKMSL